MSESWLKISLDSNYFVAGERVSGEVLINQVAPNHRILLKSSGTEKIFASHEGEAEKKYSKAIYTLSEELGTTKESQAVYPFAFQIPQFAPATFSFQSTNLNNTQMKAEVSYDLEVSIACQVPIKESISLTIYNKDARILLIPSVTFSSQLTSCWCVNRGLSEIIIDSLEKSHVNSKDVKKYNVFLASSSNTQLESVICQVVFDLTFTLPNEKPIHFRKIISRMLPNIQNLKRHSVNLSKLEFDFDADLSLSEIGENPSSNKTVLFNSEYKTQVFGIYNIGFRSKRTEAEIPLHVNPFTMKFVKPAAAEDWDPFEHHLRSFIISESEFCQETE